MTRKPHILFVCGRNQWRSPTAARVYANDQRIDVRSAGVSPKSRHPLTKQEVEWADLILVMEQEHKVRIREAFRDLVLPAIESLDIPDDYGFMDEELIRLLQEGIEFHLKNRLDSETQRHFQQGEP